jgi:hypothetical protein
MKLSMLTAMLLTTATLGVAPAAFADAVPADVAAAPQGQGAHAGARVNVAGEVGRYVVGPLGHVRGFILKDGTAVMLHEAAGDAMAKDVPVGQSVRVEGWSPTSSGQKAIFRPAVYGMHGQVVAPSQRGAGEADRTVRQERRAAMREELAKLPDASASGTVQTVLPGHHGKSMGVVLTDGTTVFLRPSLAKAVSSRGIRVGDRIQTSGKGAAYALGSSVLAGSVSFADGAHFEASARPGA